MLLLQLELMRRKQSMQHFDQRQILLLENAYYQVSSLYLTEQFYPRK
jgi:hypothetical protein